MNDMSYAQRPCTSMCATESYSCFVRWALRQSFALPAFSLCGEVGDGDGLGVVKEEGGGAEVVDFAIES